jgi:hypothetical protein
MTTAPADKRTLLDELDARQDEVLLQLDELNAQIEKLLAEYRVEEGSRDLGFRI